MQELLIVGTGGHAREILWIVSRLSRTFRLRLAVERDWSSQSELMGLRVEIFDEIEQYLTDLEYVIAIGDSVVRERIADRLAIPRIRPAVIVDPSVQMSNSVRIGDGSVIFPGCTLTTDISVGRHVHINSSCSIHHDAIIGDYATISPGVRIAGNVEIGARSFIGIGATIINGGRGCPIRIGEGATIAAGSCVTRDVPPGAMVAGVPAVRKR